jgi:glycosyltransferase involved in cell wall biosynthesis
VRILMAGMEWPGRVRGGLQVYFAELARGLAARGHQVFALVHGETAAAAHGLRLVSCAPPEAAALRRLLGFRRAARAVAADGVDLFNPHFAFNALGALYGGLAERIPVVCHFQGSWAAEGRVEDSTRPAWHRPAAAARFAGKTLVERLAYRRSDRFIVLSESSARLLGDAYGVDRERISVIPGGVDLERFRPAADARGARGRLGLPADRPLVLTVRRLVHRMGLDRLVTAMSHVVRRVPEALLLIGGEGPARGLLGRLVEERGLTASVRFLGPVPDDLLAGYLAAADLVVVSSVALEGFGLATLEALACGTPVIGTPVGATPEVLEGLTPRLLSEDASAEALAATLSDALGSPPWLPSRHACRAFAERYGWDRIVPRVEAVFRECAEGAP